LRTFTQELRPPTLARFGLEKAIHAHLENFQEKNPQLTVHFETRQDAKLIPDPTRVAVFRIYQEALTNIVKHSQASLVDIHLEKDESQLIMTIEDNGNGFVPPTDWLAMAREGHLGLVGMRERAEAIHGSLDVESQPGSGTKIRLTVPFGRKGTSRLGK
jgi:signal transduction histidine kinase